MIVCILTYLGQATDVTLLKHYVSHDDAVAEQRNVVILLKYN